MADTPPSHRPNQPIVLIVDDRDDGLKTDRTLFEIFGCAVVEARTKREAFRIIVNAEIDLVFTDINLDAGPDGQNLIDQSGTDLGRAIGERFEDLPVVGNSSLFDESEVRDCAQVFRGFFRKGRQTEDEMLAKYREFVQMAHDHYRSRVGGVADELTRLQRRYGITDDDMELLRENIQMQSTSDVDATPLDVFLQKNGYRLYIHDVAKNRPTRGAPVPAKKSIPIWLRNEDNSCQAHLHRFSWLTASGKNEALAVNKLLLLIDRRNREFQTQHRIPYTPVEKHLQAYLQKLL